MTLSTLLISIAIVAAVLTALNKMIGNSKNLLISYLQNFCGALFVFSGWVKAVDPLGTAYKMEQYFAEFESTFQETFLSFLAPLFPFLSEYAVTFSVSVIIFEIVLGIMLILGSRPKFTAWAFLLLVGFFTFLTGFTYLTGYVPDGVNFFSIGEWGEYVETNMKVTDCGCFGDFLVLKPYVSFLKDVFLLIPAFIFVLTSSKMHQWFSVGGRTVLQGIATIGLFFYCLSNFYWDIPKNDFRPFKKGVNIAERKAIESEAQSSIEVLAYHMTNKESGQVVEIPFAQYMKEFKQYPKEEWKLEQIKSEPTVERTKISDFEASNDNGEDITPEILSDPNYSFMLIAYKLKGDVESEVITVQDTTYTIDTLAIEDTFQLVKKIEGIVPRKITEDNYTFYDDYLYPWINVVNPVMNDAMAAGLNVFCITALADPDKLEDFRHASQSAYPFYQADDILLKTIVRSNPGIVLLKNGVVINKWHYKKLPSFAEIKAENMSSN